MTLEGKKWGIGTGNRKHWFVLCEEIAFEVGTELSEMPLERMCNE
jgi:hypothetical protein